MHSIFFYFLIVLGGAETACWILALHEVQGEEEKSYLFPGVELPALYLVSENTHVFCLFSSPQIQQRSCTESTVGTEPGLLYTTQPVSACTGGGQLAPRAQRAFCFLCTLPFQPGQEDFVLWLLFPVAFTSSCRKKEIICPDPCPPK